MSVLISVLRIKHLYGSEWLEVCRVNIHDKGERLYCVNFNCSGERLGTLVNFRIVVFS